MFFTAKKKDLLYLENVKVGCEPASKEEIIRTVGGMLVGSGYVKPDYVDAMIEREKTCSTFLGNGLALPHGVEAAKKEVKCSGISIMTFPEGIDWDGNTVNMVIGVAGVGEDHLEILGIVAEKMADPETASILAKSDAQTIYNTLMGRE